MRLIPGYLKVAGGGCNEVIVACVPCLGFVAIASIIAQQQTRLVQFVSLYQPAGDTQLPKSFESEKEILCGASTASC